MTPAAVLLIIVETLVATMGAILTVNNVRLYLAGQAGLAPIVLTAVQVLVTLAPIGLAIAGETAAWPLHLAGPFLLLLAGVMLWRRTERKDAP